jgi:hypothetical protein
MFRRRDELRVVESIGLRLKLKKLKKEIRKIMNEKRVARICWNTNQWLKPSGRTGKSTAKLSYEGVNGYGYEEWLFDFTKLIDGYKYGYLQPIRLTEYPNTLFDIRLYTLNKSNGFRYWIGDLFNVSVLSAEEKAALQSIYETKGWINSMDNDLRAKGIIPQNDFSLNVRFKKEDAVRFVTPIKIDPKEALYDIKRYTFLTESYYPSV